MKIVEDRQQTTVSSMLFEMEGHREMRLVAMWDGALVGVATLVLNGTHGVLPLVQVYVMDGLRGRGIGTALVEYALHIAALEGADVVTVLSKPDVASFYVKLGFVLEGRADDDFVMMVYTVE